VPTLVALRRFQENETLSKFAQYQTKPFHIKSDILENLAKNPCPNVRKNKANPNR